MSVYQDIYKVTDIALPTFDDEKDLFAYASPEIAMDAIASFGVTEIVLKMGEQGCFYDVNGQRGFVPVTPVHVVDTTSAGDSFNAGYLSQRVMGADVESACKVAHQLASTVVQHKGAIIPKNSMPFA
jgi:2-dehydro-3-deoxygluconokinase